MTYLQLAGKQDVETGAAEWRSDEPRRHCPLATSERSSRPTYTHDRCRACERAVAAVVGYRKRYRPAPCVRVRMIAKSLFTSHAECYTGKPPPRCNKSLFSFLHKLATWHYPHSLAVAAVGRAAVEQYLLPSGPQQRTSISGFAAVGPCRDKQTHRDGRTLYRYMYPAPMRAMPCRQCQN